MVGKEGQNYRAVVLGIHTEDLKVVVQYEIDESISFYTLEELGKGPRSSTA